MKERGNSAAIMLSFTRILAIATLRIWTLNVDKTSWWRLQSVLSFNALQGQRAILEKFAPLPRSFQLILRNTISIRSKAALRISAHSVINVLIAYNLKKQASINMA